MVYLNKKDPDKAIDDCNQMLRLDPKSADAYYNRGEAHADKKEYDKALGDFDASIREKHASLSGMDLLGEIDLFPIIGLIAGVKSVPIAGQAGQRRVRNRARVRPIAEIVVGEGLIILGGPSFAVGGTDHDLHVWDLIREGQKMTEVSVKRRVSDQ